nr:MAG TPA: hypothetical protein [Caudoviricetes sp.]
MAKITGVIFNGDEQIICTGELSTVIDTRLKEAGTYRKETKRKEVKRRVHDIC